MAKAQDKLTEDQVHAFLEGKPVKLNSEQLTAVIRYMASSTPIAVTRVGELTPENRTYIAVSLRRIPGAGELAADWLKQSTAEPDDVKGEIEEAYHHLVD